MISLQEITSLERVPEETIQETQEGRDGGKKRSYNHMFESYVLFIVTYNSD